MICTAKATQKPAIIKPINEAESITHKTLLDSTKIAGIAVVQKVVCMGIVILALHTDPACTSVPVTITLLFEETTELPLVTSAEMSASLIVEAQVDGKI